MLLRSLSSMVTSERDRGNLAGRSMELVCWVVVWGFFYMSLCFWNIHFLVHLERSGEVHIAVLLHTASLSLVLSRDSCLTLQRIKLKHLCDPYLMVTDADDVSLVRSEFIATGMIYARGTIEGWGILNPWVVGQAIFSSEALISGVTVKP